MSLASEIPVVDEERSGKARDDASWAELLARLGKLSVTRHFDAYGDVDWDSEELRLDPEDPRWVLGDGDGGDGALEPLGCTDWYRSQPAAVQARIGCDLVASRMKLGLQFESVLKRGLLEFAAKLPNGSPEFRYAYHEVIEEAQHSLMFQEFVNRSGFDAKGLRPFEQFMARRIVSLARTFPELFFIFVLAGEDPIDHYQRKVLREAGDLPPLVERIMRIHITEEARHLSFARHYLRRQVPTLSRRKQAVLAVRIPFILGQTAQMMLKPSSQIVRRYEIPSDVIRTAYVRNHDHIAATADSLSKVRDLCDELGLRRGPYRFLWRAFRLEATAA